MVVAVCIFSGAGLVFSNPQKSGQPLSDSPVSYMICVGNFAAPNSVVALTHVSDAQALVDL